MGEKDAVRNSTIAFLDLIQHFYEHLSVRKDAPSNGTQKVQLNLRSHSAEASYFNHSDSDSALSYLMHDILLSTASVKKEHVPFYKTYGQWFSG